jgi:hypothetical protein
MIVDQLLSLGTRGAVLLLPVLRERQLATAALSLGAACVSGSHPSGWDGWRCFGRYLRETLHVGQWLPRWRLAPDASRLVEPTEGVETVEPTEGVETDDAHAFCVEAGQHRS